MQENARRIGPLTGNRVRRQLSERRVHPREENAGDCSHGTKCNSCDLMVTHPMERVHLALFAFSPSSTRRRMASERSSFPPCFAIHSSMHCISYSVHCGFGLAASAFCAMPFATATDAVILARVLSFIGSSPSLLVSRRGPSTGYAA